MIFVMDSLIFVFAFAVFPLPQNGVWALQNLITIQPYTASGYCLTAKGQEVKIKKCIDATPESRQFEEFSDKSVLRLNAVNGYYRCVEGDLNGVGSKVSMKKVDKLPICQRWNVEFIKSTYSKLRLRFPKYGKGDDRPTKCLELVGLNEKPSVQMATCNLGDKQRWGFFQD